MIKGPVLIQKNELERFVQRIFSKVGLDEAQAQTIARHLVLANLRGIDSHGVTRVGIYSKRIELGLTNKESEVQLERETASSALVDARNTSGIVAATTGIKLAVQKAKATGVGVVGIKNSNHCGMLADYTQYAAENDCISIATTNAPPNMAPWGGKERYFGTNPFSYSIPAGEEIDIVFDMATSVVARGKIINAEKNNQQIPLGWAISKDGKPTTDPSEALDGLVLPVGGPKGYGIAMLVDVLSGLFTGALNGPWIRDLYRDFTEPQNVGQFFMVMRADLFQPLEVFKSRMDQAIQEIRAIPTMEGVDRIYLPGEIERLTMLERERNGIPLSPQIVNELVEVAEKYSVTNTLLKKIS